MQTSFQYICCNLFSITNYQEYKTKSQEALKKALIEHEELQKQLKKKALNEKLLKFGTPFLQKSAIRFTEGWEDGEEFIKLQKRQVISIIVKR